MNDTSSHFKLNKPIDDSQKYDNLSTFLEKKNMKRNVKNAHS